MCNSRYYDAVSVGVSILVGIIMTVLAIFNLLTAGITAPIIGIALGVLALLSLVISAGSLLRQAAQYGECLCQKAVRLLIGALWLIIVSGFTLVFLLTNLIISLILGFFIFSLISYTLFSLYCFLHCIVRAGCESAEEAARAGR